MKIRRVEAPRCLVGEGPVWDAVEQALYYLDITGRKIHRHDPATGANRTWETPPRSAPWPCARAAARRWP